MAYEIEKTSIRYYICCNYVLQINILLTFDPACASNIAIVNLCSKVTPYGSMKLGQRWFM